VKPLRVLLINNHEQIGGGSERVYQSTARLLETAGHEVATLSCGSAAAEPSRPGTLLPLNGYIVPRSPVATLRNLSRYVYWPRAAAELDRLLESFRPDVVHLHIFYGQLSSAILPVLRRRRVRTVMTVHEYRMLCPVSTLYTPGLGVCERCAGGNYLPAVRHRCNRGSLAASTLSAVECMVRDARFDYGEHIDHFLMVSRFCLDKHLQHRPQLASKSSVLYNFVETGRDPGQPSAGLPTVLYAGRLAPEKGLSLLCDAVARRRDLRLQIAGAGPLEETLRQRFRDAASIEFVGKLDSESLRTRMNEAWCTVAPSEWYENNPMSVLESMACGTPVLGARIGGIPELVRPDQTGWLFEPSSQQSLSDALDRAVATTRDQRMAMGQASRDYVATHHAPQAHLQQLLGAYGTRSQS
jgi:glycosyltransferase involved in cell wall biosynthesis